MLYRSIFSSFAYMHLVLEYIKGFFFPKAITCPALPAPSNGIRQGCSGTTTEYFNTVCLFSCNVGFNGYGSPSRKCQENGTWSGQVFHCQGENRLRWLKIDFGARASWCYKTVMAQALKICASNARALKQNFFRKSCLYFLNFL